MMPREGKLRVHEFPACILLSETLAFGRGTICSTHVEPFLVFSSMNCKAVYVGALCCGRSEDQHDCADVCG